MAAVKPLPKFDGVSPVRELTPEELAEEGMSKPTSRSSSKGRTDEKPVAIKMSPSDTEEGHKVLGKNLARYFGRGKSTRRRKHKKKVRRTAKKH